MGLIGGLIKTVIDVAVVLPVSVVSDVFTLGGELNDTKPKTTEAIKDIIEDLDNLV